MVNQSKMETTNMLLKKITILSIFIFFTYSCRKDNTNQSSSNSTKNSPKNTKENNQKKYPNKTQQLKDPKKLFLNDDLTDQQNNSNFSPENFNNVPPAQDMEPTQQQKETVNRETNQLPPKAPQTENQDIGNLNVKQQPSVQHLQSTEPPKIKTNEKSDSFFKLVIADFTVDYSDLPNSINKIIIELEYPGQTRTDKQWITFSTTEDHRKAQRKIVVWNVNKQINLIDRSKVTFKITYHGDSTINDSHNFESDKAGRKAKKPIVINRKYFEQHHIKLENPNAYKDFLKKKTLSFGFKKPNSITDHDTINNIITNIKKLDKIESIFFGINKKNEQLLRKLMKILFTEKISNNLREISLLCLDKKSQKYCDVFLVSFFTFLEKNHPMMKLTNLKIQSQINSRISSILSTISKDKKKYFNQDSIKIDIINSTPEREEE